MTVNKAETFRNIYCRMVTKMMPIASMVLVFAAMAVAAEQSQDLKSAATSPGSVEHRADSASAGPAQPNVRVDADDPDPFGPPSAGPRGSKEPPSKSSAESTQAVPNPSGAAGAPQQADLDENSNDPFAPPGFKPPKRPAPAAIPPILAKLKGLGWRVIMDQRDDTVHVSDDFGKTLSVGDMLALAALPNLASLKVRTVPSFHLVIGALAKSPKLDSLSLRASNVSDRDVKMIARLPKLRSLDLSRTKIGSRGVAPLKGHPALRELNLEFTRVDNAAMETLSGNENLTSLNVWATRVDDCRAGLYRQASSPAEIEHQRQHLRRRACGHRGARRTGGVLGSDEDQRRWLAPPAEHDEHAATLGSGPG